MKINGNFKEYFTDYKTDVICFIGGGGSGKSFNVLQQIIPFKFITQANKTIMVLRKSGATLNSSVIKNVINALEDFGLEKDVHYKHNKSLKTIDLICNINGKLTTGNQILFRGLDDNTKIKSTVGITDVVLEEATDFTFDDWLEIKIRLRDKDGDNQSKKQFYLMLNPEDEFFWTYKVFEDLTDKLNVDIYQKFKENDLEELKNKPKKWYFETEDSVQIKGKTEKIKTSYKVFRSNYEDNELLDSQTIANIESYKYLDYDRYVKYRLGLSGKRKEVIFDNFEVRELDLNIFYEDFQYGLDFGFSLDPTAVIKIIKNKDILYIYKELIYSTDLSNFEISEELKNKGITQKDVIMCDSAEPKSIKELRNNRINAINAKKGAGSINEGIKRIKSRKIIIDPSCKNVIFEFKNYRRKLDKSGNVTSAIIDKNNHAIDAIRYALSDISEGRVY